MKKDREIFTIQMPPAEGNTFDWDEFKPEKYFSECVFGWFEDVYVCVNREDYDNAKNSR